VPSAITSTAVTSGIDCRLRGRGRGLGIVSCFEFQLRQFGRTRACVRSTKEGGRGLVCSSRLVASRSGA
jgi:hypothetical protein